MHFCGDNEQLKFFFRTIDSVNQFNIHGAVSVGEKTSLEGCEVKNSLAARREVGSLATNSHRTKVAAGNCWQEHSQKFQMVISDEQLHTACEETKFVRSSLQELFHKTCEDVDDGFGIFFALCRNVLKRNTHCTCGCFS